MNKIETPNYPKIVIIVIIPIAFKRTNFVESLTDRYVTIWIPENTADEIKYEEEFVFYNTEKSKVMCKTSNSMMYIRASFNTPTYGRRETSSENIFAKTG